MYFTPTRYPYRALPGAEHAVLVAGAGPVGLATALGLARRGVEVTLLEAEDSVCFGSRAICLSRHSLEILDRLGEPGQRLAEKALPWTTGHSYYRDAEVLTFEMPHAPDDPHPPMVNISQSAAGQVLVDAALKEPRLTIAWGHTVRSVSQDDDQVTVTVVTPDGERELTCQWLVAADGARSKVRGALRLYLHGTAYAGYYVIADIHWESGLPTERRLWFDPPVSPGQTVLLHRQPDDIWRFDCQLPPEADPEREMQPDRVSERVKAHLEWIGNTAPWTLEWSSVYCARALSLDDYVHGRVAFAGDAAHQIPIFGVRGLNSGFEDAETLAWMLAAITAGTASPQLLRAYGQERRDAWQQNVAAADLSTVFMSPPTDGYRATRDAVLELAKERPDLQELINPRQTAATHARRSPLTLARRGHDGSSPPVLPGDPVPDVRAVSSGGRLTSLHAARGPDFTLLGFGTGTAAALALAASELRERLAPALGVSAVIVAGGPADAVPSAGVPGVTVLAGAPPSGAGGQVAAALGAQPGEVLAIRPDGLLLARWASTALMPDAGALAGHICRGGSAEARGDAGQAGRGVARGRAGQPSAGPSYSPAEQAWRTLSEAIDRVPPEGREAFLLRLAVLASIGQPGRGALEDLIGQAQGPRRS